MKKLFLVCGICFFAVITAWSQHPWENGKLKLSDNKRYLQHENGQPFFWQGDIAWLLLQRMSREEMKMYFENRKAKGFNVVQLVFLQYHGETNFYGDSAYHDRSLEHPAETPGKDPSNMEQYDFWDHADYAVSLAAQNGIYLAIAPTWGQLVKRDEQYNPEKATRFASLLAGRYKDQPNIIWLIGGAIPGDMKKEVWEAMGSTIKKTAPDHLVTFHPFGRSQSSTWFQQSHWMDFNMYVSGHRNYRQDDTPKKYGEDNWRYVLDDLTKDPQRPTIDGESSFENTPQGLHDHSQPYWKAWDVRRYAYWSVLAGAMGHTYGQNSVRQVYKKGVNKPESGATLSFVEALEDTGSWQMRHLSSLILSRPYFDRRNDQSLVLENGEKYDRILVSRGDAYLFAYTANGRSFMLKMGVLPGKKLNASWYNPRNGESIKIGKLPNTGSRNFDPPGEKANGNDWVLVLDDASKKFKQPGQRD